MNLSEWFSYQLKASGEGFVWGVEQVPVERREITPLSELGEWSVARHIFHMFYYEREMVTPSMQSWLRGETFLIDWDEYDEDKAWESQQPTSIEALLAEFQRVRNEQIELLPQFDEALWNEEREAIWGKTVSMKLIVTKTFQHTAEHTNDVLQIALFWDSILRRQEEEEAKQQEGETA